MSQRAEKWNPLTFAIYNGNLELVKFIIQRSGGNLQRMLKIPGLFKTQEISRLYPFIVALRSNNVEMFKFFWTKLAFVYGTEETFVSLFKLLAKREQSELINFFLGCKVTRTLFHSMSYSYRSEFID